MHLTWDFRGVPFEVIRYDGQFRYQRTVEDSLGTPVVEVMQNEGSWIEVAGEDRDVDAQARARLETAVNSVVYFGFLPFRLDDPPVRAADLGIREVAGEPYRKIEITFEQAGGGPDWEDRFIYWFHDADGTLDYLAYREARMSRRPGSGARSTGGRSGDSFSKTTRTTPETRTWAMSPTTTGSSRPAPPGSSRWSSSTIWGAGPAGPPPAR